MTPCRAAPTKLDAERQALIVKWQGYALMLAGRWCKNWYQAPHAEDVRSEALLGLVEGAGKWDPSRGSFSACVHWYIMNRLRDYEREGTRVVKLPRRVDASPPQESSLDVATKFANGEMGRNTWHELLAEQAAADGGEDRDAASLFAQVEDALVMYRLAQPAPHGQWPGREARARRDARIFIGHRFLGQTLEDLGAQEGVTRQRAQQCVLLMQPAFDAWRAEHRAEAEGKAPPVRRVGGAR